MANKLLFIEANTTGTGMLALQKAAALGMEPLFFTCNPQYYSGLTETGCPVVLCDTNNFAALQTTIEELTSPADRCGIVTTSEFYVETVAVLATHYNLPGNPVDAIKNTRNKALMRHVLKQAEVRQPRFTVVHDADGIVEAMEHIGLPFVLKPADDTGSNNVLLCQTQEQAERHARKILATRVNVRGQQTAGVVVAEEYLEAAEFSVEMLTWQGETTCVGITQKSLTGFPYFVEACHLFPAALPEAWAADIQATVRQALSTLGISHGTTHTEVKWTPAGCAIIEVNARLAGGMIPELIRLATGVDMLEQHLRCAVSEPAALQVKALGVAGIQFFMADRSGFLQGIEGMEEAARVTDVIQVKAMVRPETLVQLPQNAYHRLGYVIVHSENHEMAIQRLQEATSKVRMHIAPRPLSQ